jgi:hypothetical protein
MCPGPPVSRCSCPTQCAQARLSAPLPHPRGAGRAAWPHHTARARQYRAAASRAPFTGQAGHPLHNSRPPSCHVAPPGAAPPPLLHAVLLSPPLLHAALLSPPPVSAALGRLFPLPRHALTPSYSYHCRILSSPPSSYQILSPPQNANELLLSFSLTVDRPLWCAPAPSSLLGATPGSH